MANTNHQITKSPGHKELEKRTKNQKILKIEIVNREDFEVKQIPETQEERNGERK
jgi:hypothetical protein